MPKRTITQVGSAKDANTIKEATTPKAVSEQRPTMKDQQEMTPKVASTSGFEKQKDEKTKPPQTPRRAPTAVAATPLPKAPTAVAAATGHRNTPPKPQTNGKEVEALEPSKQQEETAQKKAASVVATTKQTQEKTAGSADEIVEKKADESKAGLKNLVKEEESGKTKDSDMSETSIPKISEREKRYDKAVDGAVEEKSKESGSSFLEKAKEMRGMDTIMKTVKRLATDDYEDRQLLLNIGVSVLVIVALGAYITHSYRSSGKAKD